MDFTAKYTADQEEIMLLRKINDLVSKSRREFSAVYSHFRDPSQQALVARVNEFLGTVSFEGGYEDAERRLCRVCTDEYNADDGAPLVLFKAEASAKTAELSHRDVLGSLMGLGIKREMVGDILADGSAPCFFCHEAAAEYVEFNLQKIGHYPVKVSRGTLSDIPEPKFEWKSVNVSSMRLDCLAAEGFGLSRSKAADFIKKGAAAVNWVFTTEPSKEIHPGDKISLRGRGKFQVGEISGTSKKGRLFVQLKKYL